MEESLNGSDAGVTLGGRTRHSPVPVINLPHGSLIRREAAVPRIEGASKKLFNPFKELAKIEP